MFSHTGINLLEVLRGFMDKFVLCMTTNDLNQPRPTPHWTTRPVIMQAHLGYARREATSLKFTSYVVRQ